MKILVLDEDIKTINFLKIVESQRDYNIMYNDFAIQRYRKDQFDLVIVDIASEKNEQFLNEILEVNSQQKVIVFSEKLDCDGEVSCNHCVESYNKKRLLKPLNLESFLDLINNFDKGSCKYAKLNCFETIIPILEQVVERFSYYNFNKEQSIIYTKQKDSPFLIQQFLELLGLLDNHNVPYEITGERNLQIIA